MIKFVTIGVRTIALHHVCGTTPAANKSLRVITCGGDIEIPGDVEVAQFMAELEQYKKDTAPKKAGRPAAGSTTEPTTPE